MQHGAVVSTPDPLSGDLVNIARSKAAVFLFPQGQSRVRLDQFYAENAGRIRHFANERELASESVRLRRLRGGTLFDRCREAVGLIFGGVAIAVGDFPIELTFASNQSRFALRDDSVGQIVRISENELTPSTLAKFLDAYTFLPTDQRPILIIETHDSASDIDRRLRQIPEPIEIMRLDEESGLKRLVLERLPSQSMLELVDQYSENSFSAISRLESSDLVRQLPRDESLERLISARLFHLRATASERGKFATLPAADALAQMLEERNSALDGAQAPVLLAGKVFTNLWLLYCRETDTQLFDNAMAIAAALGDEVIQAHCMRLINAVHPHGSFTDSCSRRAAAIFMERGLLDYSSYCLNNALVGKFFTFERSSHAFAEMIDGSFDQLDGFRGLPIMMNNAGVANLIEGNATGALEWFGRALKQPTMPVHRFGISVNAMIAEYIEGGDPAPEKLLRTARAIVRQIDPQYQYHTAHLLMNLSSLARADSDCAREIREILRETGLLTEPLIVDDRTTLASLGRQLGLLEQKSEFPPGARGAFLERHQLIPNYHHIWL